jgi:hypothetical protein
MVGRARGVALVALVALFAGLSASSLPIETAAGASTDVTSEVTSPRIVGRATVVASDYPLGNTSGWSSAVVFRARNPSSRPVVGALVRVHLRGASGAVVGVAGEQERLDFRPHQTRLVVVMADSEGERPSSARVRLYPAQPGSNGTAASVPSEPSKWKVTKVAVRCPFGVVECRVSGVARWSGGSPQFGARVSIVVHQAGAADRVMAAGAGPLDAASALGRADPQTPVPFDLFVTGLRSGMNPAGDTTGVLPALMCQVYVQSEQ